MIVRTLSTFSRRFFTAFVIGTVAVPTVALASGDPVVAVAASTPLRAPVSIADRAIAPGVDKRNPVAAGAEFDASVGALYAWVKVKNLGDETTVTMVWKREGKRKLSVTLPVGHSYGWKTWSKKGITAKDAGAWTVEALDADGALLETIAFNVGANAGVSSNQ